MRNIAVILLSGGLDSTTLAAHAVRQGYELRAVTLHYGQKHSKEVDCARRVARHYDIKQEVVDISFFKKLAWYSALTNPVSLSVPRRRQIEEIPQSIPITYVPLRNTMFISMAAAFLESEVLHLIEVEKARPEELEASVLIAANAVDYSGYPDCRPEYYQRMAAALGYGSKLGTTYLMPIKIETPIIEKTKAQIVAMALEMAVPLELTWSCYEGGDIPCGECDSCILRARGFAEAGVRDPLLGLIQDRGHTARRRTRRSVSPRM